VANSKNSLAKYFKIHERRGGGGEGGVFFSYF
jgi:hypothetical protein